MQLLSFCVLLLAVCGVSLAGYSHGGSSSYSVVTKHDYPSHKSSHSYGGGYGGGEGGFGSGYYGGGSSYGGDHGHDYHKHPKYQFDYGVKDLKTGDIKNQWEHRDGGHVKGELF